MQERTEEAKPRESVPPLGELVATGEASAGEPAAPTPTVESALSEGDKAKQYGVMEVSTEWGRGQGKGK